MRKTIDSLPYILKVLLAIFVGCLYGSIYRIVGGTTKDIVIGVLWFVTGGVFGIGWLIDLVTVVLHGKPTVLV